jgi:hypothetical protein
MLRFEPLLDREHRTVLSLACCFTILPNPRFMASQFVSVNRRADRTSGG